MIGLLCGILNTIPYTRQDPPVKRFFLKLLRALIRIYVEVFRGTPMVLQAVFIFYGLPYFTDGAVAFKGMGGIWVAAIIVVSINTGAYMAESVRAALFPLTRPDRRRESHRYDPCADHGECHHASGAAEHHPQIGNNLLSISRIPP